jgi:hypothetical protein
MGCSGLGARSSVYQAVKVMIAVQDVDALRCIPRKALGWR